MSTLHQPEPARPRTATREAFVVSLVIEALMLAAVAGWFAHVAPKPQPKPPEPIKVVIAAPTPAPPAPMPAPPKAAPAKPPEPAKAPPVHPVKPAVMRHTPPPVVPKPELPKAPAPSTESTSAPQPPAPAPEKAQDEAKPTENAPPPPAERSDAKPSALFQARLRDAVQAAVRYPSAARIMKLRGHVRLGFGYQDGVISNPHVVQSSGQSVLDEAALAALNSAAFPAPPPELKGHPLNLEIVVTFAPSS
jgi:protein TonB